MLLVFNALMLRCFNGADTKMEITNFSEVINTLVDQDGETCAHFMFHPQCALEVPSNVC